MNNMEKNDYDNIDNDSSEVVYDNWKFVYDNIVQKYQKNKKFTQIIWRFRSIKRHRFRNKKR